MPSMKRIMLFSPFCYVHHLQYSFGWAFLPLLSWTAGYFEFGKSHDKYGNWKPKWAFRFVKTKDFHNCSWTGFY